jgi:hypothetical protein
MLWLIVALLLLVVIYLFMKLGAMHAWEKTFYDAVVKEITRCCSPADKTWPPQPPPDWP